MNGNFENKNNIITNYYTPTDVVNLITSNLPRPYVAVVGSITKKKGYFKLSDENTDLSLISLSGDYNDYQEGYRVEAYGYLNYQVSSGAVYPRLDVERLRILNKKEDNSENVKELIRKKTNRGFVGYISSIAKKDFVNILLIHGQGAQVHRDFENAFSSSIGYYKDRVNLQFVETRLNDDDLSQTLKQIDTSKYDLVFIIRGGGSEQELSRVGGIKSLNVIIEKDIPLYLALGHSLDKGLSLLEKVADYSFPTPSIAGQETGRLLRLYFEEEELKRQNEKLRQEIVAIKTQFAQTETENIKNLQRAVNSLQKQLTEKNQEFKSLLLFTENLKAENSRLREKKEKLQANQQILYLLLIIFVVLLTFAFFVVK